MVIRKQIEKLDLAKYTNKTNKWIILEVDLEYPQELHDFIMIIHYLQKKWKWQKICYQIIVNK